MSEPERVGAFLDDYAAHLERVRVAQRAANRVPPARLYNCPVCLDSGFEHIADAGHGTVRRCENGCRPPRLERPKRERPRVQPGEKYE